VHSALQTLQEKYGFGSNYVLIGHSAGATLAFQILMQRSLLLPRAVVGIAGIYDIPSLVTHHASIPVYRDFITAAFGADERVWAEASPARAAKGAFGGWKEVEAVVLAWSSGDSLVEEGQVGGMEGRVRGDWGEGVVWRRELSGAHDEVGEDGGQMVGLVASVVRKLGEGE